MTRDAAYAVACREAATAQGLDPASVALEAHAAVIPDVGVEQTGGFTMVLTCTDPRDSNRIFTITCEAETDDGTPLYLVVNQPTSNWYDGEWVDADITVCADGVTAAQLVAIVVHGEAPA